MGTGALGEGGSTPRRTAPRRGRTGLALATLLVLLALWGGAFIYRTSFVVGGQRYFCLFDDAMISMSYARNLVEGFGLSWAREGAPSEGFTSPLWTLAMVPVNLLPLPLSVRPLLVQLLSLAVLLVHLAVVRRLTVRHFAAGATAWWLPAAVLTAFFYPLDYWALIGMEVGLQALLATAAVLFALEIVERGRDRVLPLCLTLAVAYLVRMDMAILIAACLGFVALHGGIRRAEARRWLAGGAVLAGVAIGYQVFRQLYFGAPLPNTYYLKLTGIPLEVRLLRGLSVYGDFLAAQAVALLAIGLAVVPGLVRRRAYQLPVALFVLYSLYSIWVGGDAWEMALNVRANRFVAFAFPLLFVAFNGRLNELAERWRRWRRERPGSGLHRAVPAIATGLLTVGCLVAVDGLAGSARAGESRADLALTVRPLMVTSHSVVLEGLRGLERRIGPRARVATFWAGIPAYFSAFRMVDMLGYTDPHVARLDSVWQLDRSSFDRYTPGHAKWDYDYVFEDRRPDAFFQAWAVPDAVLAPKMAEHGFARYGDYWIRPEALVTDR